jgi:SAM-dependent methyltransferase
MTRTAAALAALMAGAAGAQMNSPSPGEAEAKMFSAGTAYESYMGRWSRLLAPKFIAFTGVREGDRVLDVGTGTGSLASSLAEALHSVEVVAIDPSEGFIGFAQKRSGSARIRFERGDAQALRFPDASFDASMALLVMNFVPDHRKAAAEMRRVTRPGGRVGACVWDYDAGMQSLRIFWDEVVAMDAAMAPKDERNMKLSHAGELASLWKATGLADVEEKPLVVQQKFTSFDDYWGPFLTGAGPGGAYVVSLSAARRAELSTHLKRRVLGDRQDGPFVLNASAWCVKGQAPKASP